MKRTKAKEESLKRRNRQAILFNEREFKAIEHYCQRFKINNRSKFMREAIIAEVLKKFEDNYPTLWEDQQKSLF
jgi:ABC-type dipeptide/oligopeptide/nickel transport system ATPase subunit